MSLLSDKSVVEEFKHDFKEYLPFNDDWVVLPTTLWEGAKVAMRGEIMKLSSKPKIV